MRLGDLAAEHQPDAGAARLGREKRHEQIRRVRESRALVLNHHLQRRGFRPHASVTPPPVSSDASTALRSRLISS